jgi:hypothetical protein
MNNEKIIKLTGGKIGTLNKEKIGKDDLKDFSREELINNVIYLYNEATILLVKNSHYLKSHDLIKKGLIRNFTCASCSETFPFPERAGMAQLAKGIMCENCLKVALDNKNKEPSKEELEEQLKYLEEIGVKQYLANSEQIYFNQIENIKKKILAKDLEK